MASDPRYRGSAFREFRHQEKLALRIRDPRNPEIDVAVWDHESHWRTGGARSESRGSGFGGA